MSSNEQLAAEVAELRATVEKLQDHNANLLLLSVVQAGYARVLTSFARGQGAKFTEKDIEEAARDVLIKSAPSGPAAWLDDALTKHFEKDGQAK